jgi:hypothetical protein
MFGRPPFLVRVTAPLAGFFNVIVPLELGALLDRLGFKSQNICKQFEGGRPELRAVRKCIRASWAQKKSESG